MSHAPLSEITSVDIRSAVQAGILTEAQATLVISYSQSRLGYREAMVKNDEPFEFFKGFAEIFISIGLGLLTGGLVGLVTLFVSLTWGAGLGLTMCLALASYYTLVRRHEPAQYCVGDWHSGQWQHILGQFADLSPSP